MTSFHYPIYCGTHNVRLCLYIAYIAYGYASLYIKTLYFFLTVLALSAAATIANIKICYDVKTLQFAIFGTRDIWGRTVAGHMWASRALPEKIPEGGVDHPILRTPPPH